MRRLDSGETDSGLEALLIWVSLDGSLVWHSAIGNRQCLRGTAVAGNFAEGLAAASLLIKIVYGIKIRRTREEVNIVFSNDRLSRIETEMRSQPASFSRHIRSRDSAHGTDLLRGTLCPKFASNLWQS